VARDQVRKVVDRSRKNKEIFIIFPFVVAGELINNLKRQTKNTTHKQEAMSRFFKLLENKKVDLKPAKADSLKLAAEIKSRDRLLGDTDLLIISQALCDSDAVHVLMHDDKIINSQEIFNEDEALIETKKRFQKLKISDSIK
jgi:hypothetical protein